MRSGPLRERITIQSYTEAADAEGQPVKTWADLATAPTVWASAVYLTGREREAMDKITTESAVKFTVHYRTDITTQMRVSWRSTYWNIHSVVPDSKKFFMTLTTSKVE